MTHSRSLWCSALVAAATIALAQNTCAAVSATEAEQLKSALTPFGAEKSANKDGSIPAWTGGYTTPIPGFKNGGRRGDPFAAEKPLYSITAKDVDQYADKLSDGAKALFKKYPATYRIDVYPTHRTAAAPTWVYDNTFKNATRAKTIINANGTSVQGAFGGIPFPIPKSGIEVVWNHQLRWRAPALEFDFQGSLGTADGKRVLTVDAVAEKSMPYYDKEGAPDKFDGDHNLFRMVNVGPPMRAGEGIVQRVNLSNDEQTWVYLTGQRRVRKLPNACCDTPTPATAGVMSVDEIEVFYGPNGRFDWKLLGKKELLIPYNNKLMQTRSADVFGPHHINPDVMRWELHRVWVVQASLKAGQRHNAPTGIYYFDEDTWNSVLADRWDANGQLWKTMWMTSMVMPDIPATGSSTFGFYDLISGTSYTNEFVGDKEKQYKVVAKIPDSVFTPDGLIGAGVR